MKRFALSCLIMAPWLGVACGNGDDNGSPVPSIPADATVDSKSDVASGDAPAADHVGMDAPASDATKEDAGDAAGDAARDAELEDGARDGGSMADADAGE
jgi:hypothetical protein